jgi:hypothetical protein
MNTRDTQKAGHNSMLREDNPEIVAESKLPSEQELIDLAKHYGEDCEFERRVPSGYSKNVGVGQFVTTYSYQSLAEWQHVKGALDLEVLNMISVGLIRNVTLTQSKPSAGKPDTAVVNSELLYQILDLLDGYKSSIDALEFQGMATEREDKGRVDLMQDKITRLLLPVT